MLKFVARLESWHEERMGMYDNDTAFQEKQHSKCGSRSAYSESVLAVADQKIAGARSKAVAAAAEEEARRVAAAEEEAARLAAEEKEAARVAAEEEETARVAAEDLAARLAAEHESTRPTDAADLSAWLTFAGCEVCSGELRHLAQRSLQARQQRFCQMTAQQRVWWLLYQADAEASWPEPAKFDGAWDWGNLISFADNLTALDRRVENAILSFDGVEWEEVHVHCCEIQAFLVADTLQILRSLATLIGARHAVAVVRPASCMLLCLLLFCFAFTFVCSSCRRCLDSALA
jgi:hypothetical protein